MSARITIDPERVNASMVAGIVEFLYALAFELEGQVKTLTPIASGALRGSFVAIEPVQLESGIVVTMGSPLEYAPYVEFGTKPHWAPIAPLIRWVEQMTTSGRMEIVVEGKSSTEAIAKGRHLRRTPALEAGIIRIAHAIQRAIAKRGTRPRYMMRDALTKMDLPFVADPSLGLYAVNVLGNPKYEALLWESIDKHMTSGPKQ